MRVPWRRESQPRPRDSSRMREGEGEEGAMWKRVFKGGAMVIKGRGWAETARTYIAGSGLKAETDKACHG